MKQHTLGLWLGGVMFGLLSSAVQAEPWTLDQTLTEAQRYSASYLPAVMKRRRWMRWRIPRPTTRPQTEVRH
jgi:hypothetical protein